MTALLLISGVLAMPGVPALTYEPTVHRRGCQTKSCVRRVHRKRMRRYIKPYRGWLRSTRACESPTGVDSAPYNSRGDRYHGYYQFDLSTWHSVGGHGDPHTKTLLTQSYRAVKLLRRAGRSRWPVCG